MPDNLIAPKSTNSFYQAPLEVNSYINPNISPIPQRPPSLYALFGINNTVKQKPKPLNPYEALVGGGDPFGGILPQAGPLQTNLAAIEPLEDSAGMFNSQDGFGKYGFSSILGGGDNEDRYAQNFRRDNPAKFFRPGFHPLEGIWKGIYWGGGFIEKTAESALLKVGQGFGSLFGLTIGNAVNATFGERYSGVSDWLSKSSDNVFSSIFNGWEENLKSRYHYFQEKSDRDRKGFISSLGDGDFWMNDVSDGISFLVSAALEVGLVSKLGLGTKAASRLAPLAEGTSTAAIGGLDASTVGSRVLKVFGGAKPFANAVDVATQTMVTTAIESAVEAQEVKEKIYSSLEGKLNPETGYAYTQDERERLAAEGAAQTFKQNMTILVGPQLLETLAFNKIAKSVSTLLKSPKAEGLASGRVRSLGSLSKGTSYEKLSRLKSFWKPGSLAALGYLSEGLWEENVQLAISRESEDIFGGDKEFFDDRVSARQENIDTRRLSMFSPFGGDVSERYLAQTKQFFKGVVDDRFIDDELSKSIGIGGLFGIAGGGITGTLAQRQQAKVDRFWSDRLNKATTTLFQSNNFYKTETINKPDPSDPTKTIPTEQFITDTSGSLVLDDNKLKNYLNSMDNIRGIMDIIANTEDPNDENNQAYQNIELNKLARNVLFNNLAMEYIKAGKKDILLANLSSASQFSKEDLQALGYDIQTLTDAEKGNVLSKMSRAVERLDKANEWIEDNIIDNVSEKREAFGGLKYSRTQREKRSQFFEAKKEYLRRLAQENVMLDSYLDDINEEEVRLEQESPIPEVLSSILDENGNIITDSQVSLSSIQRDFNARIPALYNQLDVLKEQFGRYWDSILTQQRNAPKAQEFSQTTKTNDGSNLLSSQLRAEDILNKINKVQSEIDDLEQRRKEFLSQNKSFRIVQDEDQFFVQPVSRQRAESELTLEELNNERTRRLNNIKREEIAIQKDWINEEWKLTAALKEPKEIQGRRDTLFSRRMSLSTNAYNEYFQREVLDRDATLGQRKMKLYNEDPSKRVDAKKYKANESKLLKAVRIQGKTLSIIAEVNGKKLLAELDALIEKNLQPGEFTTQLKAIIDEYNGKPTILSETEKGYIDNNLSEIEDEYGFVANIFEYMPEDDRFNDKYYDINTDGQYTVKQEYDSLPALAAVQRDLSDRIDDLKKIKDFLDSLPSEIQGDWNNIDIVKKRIADVYTDTADSIIGNYNSLSNNGQSEVAGDSLSTKQDLDLIDTEIDELGQLVSIFNERDQTDKILLSEPFKTFIPDVEERIKQLRRIRDIVKERLSSRLRENQDFLTDVVKNTVEQLGLTPEGDIHNQAIHDIVESSATPSIFSTLKTTLKDLNDLINKEDKDADDRRKIEDLYWTISGQAAGIQQTIKFKNRETINNSIDSQKTQVLIDLENTALMKRVSGEVFYKDLVNNFKDSTLGTLQTLFYNTGREAPFSQVELGGSDINFIDDQPTSPIYKFREDYNLRKLIRNLTNDNSRTPDRTEVSKEELLEFLNLALKMKNLEDLQNIINSDLNPLDQVEREKEIVQAKIDKKDNKYENLIVPSIQQLFFIRSVANFMRRNTVTKDKIGFRNWLYIQAPGGAGKTQTLGTWFNSISGVPRDQILATAFTEEAARGIKKALIVGEDGPRNASEMIDYIRELIQKKDYTQSVLIIDEYPAIDVELQKGIFDAVTEYTKLKLENNKGEFKVITMGDTNQLTFNSDGSISVRSSMIVNPNYFAVDRKGVNDNHISKMNIVPSLTVNFRTNIFPITSFIDIFKGSNKNNINTSIKVSSTDSTLTSKDVKGVVSLNKADFQTRIVNYIKANPESTRTRALIVNDSKLAEYTTLLNSSGIKIITDPNDELTKGGVYLTAVKNSQGFSFDEVFVDVDASDKNIFKESSSPNFIYNKAMYVAASRARNLIVVTNFPNYENVDDPTISTLENKALTELQTKDEDFISQRDLEIQGGKDILGENYSTIITPATSISTKEPEQEEDTADEDIITTKDIEDLAKTPIEIEVVDSIEQEAEIEPIDDTQDTEEDPIENSEVVEPTDGLEDQHEESLDTDEKSLKETAKETLEKIRDKAVQAFTVARGNIIDLLFPTSSTIKYKISDGIFSTRKPENFEYRNLQDGDEISLIPFVKSKNAKSGRNFGYAIVTPAKNENGTVIRDRYRTVSILSDTEIDRLKESGQTLGVYNTILENEKRDSGFVNILYSDVSDPNGFSKDIRAIETGSIVHSNPIKYSYNKSFRKLNAEELDRIIDIFINRFYKNRLESYPAAERPAQYQKLVEFYSRPENARIVIPTNRDLRGKNPRMQNLPQDYELKVGRPYIIFEPFDKRSSKQAISLSRRYLDTTQHGDILNPIKEFISLGKVVRANLESKGITGKLGYSKSLSNMLSRLAYDFAKNPTPDGGQFKVNLNRTINSKVVSTEYSFSLAEAERIYKLYSMYIVPNTKETVLSTDKEIQAIANQQKNKYKKRRARSYTFEDGTTIFGTIDSYDPQTKTFIVLDQKTGERSEPKSGVIKHSEKSSTGPVQEILNNIMTSNGNIASNFASKDSDIGFTTNRGRFSTKATGYDFMALLGSKSNPVTKTYNNDGSPKETYDDIIEILENLFNFANKGELPTTSMQYKDEEGTIQTQEVKFRVPVPLNKRNETNQLEHSFEYSSANTSRQSSIANAKYFETNFEDMLGSRIMIQFGPIEVAQQEAKAQIVQVSQVDQVNDAEYSTIKTENLTLEEAKNLSITDLRANLSQSQIDRLTKVVTSPENGWLDLDTFFNDLLSANESEQDLYKEYIFNCLL